MFFSHKLNLEIHIILCLHFVEELSECSSYESEDEMSVDEPKSQADSGPDAEEDEEEYETITVSEVPDERYDQNIDMTEEKEAMENLKSMFVEYIYITLLNMNY